MDRAFLSVFGTSHGLLDDDLDHGHLAHYAKNQAIGGAQEADPWLEIDGRDFTDLFSSVLDEENPNILGNNPHSLSGECPRIVSQGVESVGHESVKYEDVQELIQEHATKPSNGMVSNSCVHHHAPSEYCSNAVAGFGVPQRDESAVNSSFSEHVEGVRKLSTVEILTKAGERFIQFATDKNDGITMFIHPYGSSVSDLSAVEARDVDLMHHLFAAAEQVSVKQFDLASKLISRCLWCASDAGTPLQRLAFYFAEALKERIDRESSKMGFKKKAPEKEREELALCTNGSFLSFYQSMPFNQLLQFTGTQAIIENVKTAKKIHLIDLQIRSGIHWSTLMQALTDYSVEHLTITAVGTRDQKYIEETGKRLMSFAQTFNLNFTFKEVYLADMSDFKEELFSINSDETVVVYSFLMLRSMLSKPPCLENLMIEITKLKPATTVVVEVDANHNSPLFITRFTESLFFYGAYFDCLKDCMEKESQCRTVLERDYFGTGISNIIATEGEERITRNVKLDVWRAFLKRYGMKEIELSESSKYQASLMMNQFEHASSCTLEYNGKGLVVGWKGIPLHSLTAWKFALGRDK